ncbi:MAG TPA: Gmad2 immunoglobulin-like domain-containing protein [Saprospiraceae bacterium]|nr:Gmad2 immunoglobulin-like domain-containing protein [Saprospiraceae bacterium]
MKGIHFLLAITLAGCNTGERQNKPTTYPDTVKVYTEPTQKSEGEKPVAPLPETKTYSNERFKEVTVEKIGAHTFLVQGMGQIFEASFSWVIEDGHEELKKGFQMTDAGAPEWGKFSFTIDMPKKRTNSTLILILFESSPKDGSRQYELPVVLY